MTYKEIAKKYLESNGITIGDTIKINKEDISYEGILLDRSEETVPPVDIIEISCFDES